MRAARPANPQSDRKMTRAVSLQTLLDALAARNFIPFSLSFRLEEHSLRREAQIIKPGWGISQ
jgi:hypothetical protein